MKIVKEKILLSDLKKIAKRSFGNLVKAVVDIEKKIMVVDADLHADQESLLLKNGSQQDNLWGINLFPQAKGEDLIEFDSMINLRPSQNNLTRGVDDLQIRKKIIKIVNQLIKK